MSSLWTPSGEHVPDDETGAGDGPGESPSTQATPEDTERDAELAAELRRVRAELAATPVADIVANHAVGLWQLAVLHLTPEEGEVANLAEAALAIDAMAAIVDALGDRLGESAEALRDALAQLRVAYVQVRDRGA